MNSIIKTPTTGRDPFAVEGLSMDFLLSAAETAGTPNLHRVHVEIMTASKPRREFETVSLSDPMTMNEAITVIGALRIQWINEGVAKTMSATVVAA